MASQERRLIQAADRLYIELLSGQLDALYLAMKPERLSLALWEETEEFSILGVIELFSTEIQGYAAQVQMEQVQGSAAGVAHLRQLNIFGVDYFADWYFNYLNGEYPQLEQYIERLDHLRLLLAEYFQRRASVAA